MGQLARPQVKVPLLPCEHYYLHTKTIADLDPMTPVIRDPDGYIYLRERDGCILAGGFEPVAKPVYEKESKFNMFSLFASLFVRALCMLQAPYFAKR